MEIFLSLTFIFIVGCLLGWIIEFFFRRIVHHKWVNPGFLKGPYLPLYGFGLTALYLIAIIPFDNWISQQWLVILLKILCVGVMMTLIEYIAGLIFIKGMKIQLWDYSDRWGNIQGIICPLFSLFWAIIGAVYVLLLHPLIYEAVIWFTNNIYYSFFVGIVLGLMIFDFITTMNVAVKIKQFATEHKVLIRYEELKEHMAEMSKEFKEKHHFINPLANVSKGLNNLKEKANNNVFKKIKEKKDKKVEK